MFRTRRRDDYDDDGDDEEMASMTRNKREKIKNKIVTTTRERQ
jgi:hypothetical protein